MENSSKKSKGSLVGKIENKPVFLNNGSFGPYLRYDEKNYKVAGWYDLEKLDIDMAKEIIRVRTEYLKKKSNEEGNSSPINTLKIK